MTKPKFKNLNVSKISFLTVFLILHVDAFNEFFFKVNDTIFSTNLTRDTLTLAISPNPESKVTMGFGGSVGLEILTVPSVELVIRHPCVICTPVIPFVCSVEYDFTS